MRDGAHFPPGHFRGPRGNILDVPPPRGFGGFGVAHALFPWLFLLLFAALVAVAIIALVRFSRQDRPGNAAAPPPPAPVRGPASDQALEDLRLRYARGEIEREEYLQKSADLGSPRPPSPPAAAG